MTQSMSVKEFMTGQYVSTNDYKILKGILRIGVSIFIFSTVGGVV